MVTISESDLMRELVAEAVKSQPQPGDVTSTSYRQALADAGINVSRYQAWNQLEAQVAAGKLQRVVLAGNRLVYRKVTK